jgi:hypothetical protein
MRTCGREDHLSTEFLIGIKKFTPLIKAIISNLRWYWIRNNSEDDTKLFHIMDHVDELQKQISSYEESKSRKMPSWFFPNGEGTQEDYENLWEEQINDLNDRIDYVLDFRDRYEEAFYLRINCHDEAMHELLQAGINANLLDAEEGILVKK